MTFSGLEVNVKKSSIKPLQNKQVSIAPEDTSGGTKIGTSKVSDIRKFHKTPSSTRTCDCKKYKGEEHK